MENTTNTGNKKNLINSHYFAFALAGALSALYTIFTVLLVAIPDQATNAINQLMHVRTTTPTSVEVTFGHFIVGVIEVFVVSYILALIFVWIYNLFVKTEVSKNLKNKEQW